MNSALGRALSLAAVFLVGCSAAAVPTFAPAAAQPDNSRPESFPASPQPQAPVPVEFPPSPDEAMTGPAASPPPRNRRVEVGSYESFTSFLLPFDGIQPIYDPEFAPAAEAPLHEDELVIGISLGGAAKAYPVTVLRFREMVNDELGGIPILATW